MNEPLSILPVKKKKRRKKKPLPPPVIPPPVPWYKQKGFIILAILVLGANLGFSQHIDKDEYQRLGVCALGVLFKELLDRK